MRTSIKITLAKITSQSEIKDGSDDRIESLAQYTKIANYEKIRNRNLCGHLLLHSFLWSPKNENSGPFKDRLH